MPPHILILIYNNVLSKYTRKIQLGGLYDDIEYLIQYLTIHPKSYASILKQHTHFQALTTHLIKQLDKDSTCKNQKLKSR